MNIARLPTCTGNQAANTYENGYNMASQYQLAAGQGPQGRQWSNNCDTKFTNVLFVC